MTTSILALAALCGFYPQHDPIPAPLRDSVPALEQRSSWRFDSSAAGRSALPAPFVVGNGQVFGALGRTAQACALAGLVGPRYGLGTADLFGTLHLELVGADGAAVATSRHRIERVPERGFVIAEDSGAGFALRATWFAVPGEPRLLAALDVAADPPASLEGLAVRVWLDPGAAVVGGALQAEYRTSAERAWLQVALDGGRPARDALQVPLGAGRTWAGALGLSFGSGEAPAEPATIDRARVAEAAARTAAAWERRLAGLTRYDTDRADLRDLLAEAKLTTLAQTCAGTGAVVPMLGDRTVSVRSQSGPLLLFLRHRMADEARRILDGWWRVTRRSGRVPLRLGLDELALPAPEDPGTPEFWNAVEVPPGDVGSWIVLQHFWYWRATRDTALIERHWPLIEACFKRQPRREEILIPFAGDEPWVAGLAALPAGLLGDAPELVGLDPATGRAPDSFASSVAFLMALHAVGDLVDAVDRERRPERWAGGTPEPAPSAAYVRRAFGLMQALEERFWQADLGCFAPARSPVDGSLHRGALANANLLPLWIGWTFPSGERSRDNLRHALEQLWLDGARVGTSRSLGVATGEAQGLLLTALAERDGRARRAALDALLAMADAGGAWATFHGADGRPLDGHGARLDPQVLGLNVDALLFAITGIRQAAYANWDDEDIRLELRLPAGATWFTARGAHKDGRTLDLFFREEIAPLSEAERAANDELAPERRRDPTVPHRRVNFVVDLVEGEPAKGYYDVAINAEGTVYVRYLQPGAPAAPEQPDLRRIEETEFAAEDALAFLPARTGPAPAPAARQRSIPAGAELLVLTCRGAAADALGGAGVTLFDTAQPFAPAELEGLLLGEGRARHRRLYLDWRYQAPAPAGWNSGYFASPAWTDLLARYRSAGGEVLEPGFVRRFEVGGRASEAEADGGLALPDGDENLRVVARIEGSAAGAEAVLRLGTNAPLGLGLGGQSFATQGDPQAEPDRVAWLAQLAAGTNELVLTISPRPDGGPRRLYLRASDPAGLPLR